LGTDRENHIKIIAPQSTMEIISREFPVVQIGSKKRFSEAWDWGGVMRSAGGGWRVGVPILWLHLALGESAWLCLSMNVIVPLGMSPLYSCIGLLTS
jgi:hypothetical protein